MFKDDTSNGGSTLIRYLSPIGAWALAFGCSVGWGSFVMPGTTFLPLAGPVGTAIGMGIGGLLMLLIGVNYSFLMNRYPHSGGTYIFTKNEFGYDQGFMSAWFLILVYMAIVWANATAIPIICRNFFPGLLEVGPYYTVAGFRVYIVEALVASALIILAGFICLFGGKWTSRIQSVLALILIGGVVLCAVGIVFQKGSPLLDVHPAFAEDKSSIQGIIRIVALAPWAFVGFESISHSTEEFAFPVKHSMKIFMFAIISGVVTYSVLALMAASAVPAGCSNWTEYINNLGSYTGAAGMPTLFAVNRYLGKAGIRVLGIAVFAAVMTGLIGNTVAGSRLIYSLSRGDMLNNMFGGVNKNHVPFKAILMVTAFSIPIPFFGRTAISWIVDVNTIGATIAYMYTSISAYKRARKESNGPVQFTGLIGFFSSLMFTIYFLIPNLWSVDALVPESYLILIFWSVLGFGVFYYVLKKDKENRFGQSTVVWLVLLFLVFFLTILWFREKSNEISGRVMGEIHEFNMNQAREYGVEFEEEDELVAEENLENKIKQVEREVLVNSILQMAIIMIALVIMFQVYHSMQERERALELEKLTAEKNSKAKSAFLSNMSHDIRTPMNAILGYTTLALDIKELPDEAREYLEKIDYSGKHLIALINDILDMSRIENGKMELADEPTDLCQIFHEVYTIFDPQMKSKKIDFRVSADAITDKYVMCDSSRLIRVLLNLISNAHKFTSEKGKISVVIRQLGTEGNRGQYEIKVRDNGAGMSPEFVKTIFDEYTRERTAAKVQGTGLGMAITKSILDLVGGSISVESQKGKGTEFTVNVSFELTNQEEYYKHHKYEDIYATMDYSNVNVLLVDDVAINREIILKILAKYGFKTDYAINGQEAIKKIKESEAGTYQLVLMDIQMPITNGYHATKAIRALDDKEKANVPVIAMSANAFEEDIHKSLESGMNGHIAKPIEISKMMETINEIING